MRKINKRGFTIVELVIVIAVIAILAGVMIPTFSAIVDKAQKSAILQEAKNSYTLYLQQVDPAIEEIYSNIWIMVNTNKGCWYVEVVNGSVQNEINSQISPGIPYIIDGTVKTPEFAWPEK